MDDSLGDEMMMRLSAPHGRRLFATFVLRVFDPLRVFVVHTAHLVSNPPRSSVWNRCSDQPAFSNAGSIRFFLVLASLVALGI